MLLVYKVKFRKSEEERKRDKDVERRMAQSPANSTGVGQSENRFLCLHVAVLLHPNADKSNAKGPRKSAAINKIQSSS
jgi:hypothetical protein